MDRNKLVAVLREAHDDFKRLGKPIRLDISVKDILDAIDETEFMIQKWISPKDRLPTEGQEVEFVATYTYNCGISKRKRFQGLFRRAEMNSDFKVFFAYSIGWGCEFLIEEVECWMPKVPMPEEKNERTGRLRKKFI